MDSAQPSPIRMTGEEFALHVSRPQVRIFGILLLVLAAALVAGFRHRFAAREVTLALWAVLSGVTTASYGRQLMMDAGAGLRRSYASAARAAGGFVPLALAFYLTFYEGVWKLLSVFAFFSFVSLVARLAFLYLGYRLATWLMYLSEIPRRLARGDLIVTDPPIKAQAA